jgi:hypothetical protein
MCRFIRGSIRLACGDLPGAEADSEKAVEVARLAKDPQIVTPALQARANVLLEQQVRTEVDAIAEELFALGPKFLSSLVTGFSTSIVDFAWLTRTLGRERELLGVLEGAPETPWTAFARAVAGGDSDEAATTLEKIECRSGAAYTHLRAAEELVGTGRAAETKAHAEAALVFYRAVGAAYFVRKAEAAAAPSAIEGASDLR